MGALTRPKPRKETIPLERLRFDRRLQQREFAGDAMFDEAWVEQLIEAKAGGADFPPLEAVYDGKKYWVFAGFHRGEMYRRAATDDGPNSVEVLIYEGTFEDALFYSLSENSKHGKSRRPEDCRKAFNTIITNAKLRNRVLNGAKDVGGCYKACAAACGLSHGGVGKYLKDAGFRFSRGGAFEPVPPEEPEPKPAPAATEQPAAAEDPKRETAAANPEPSTSSAVASIFTDPGIVLSPRLPDEPEEQLRKAASMLQRAFLAVMDSPLADELIRIAARHDVKITRGTELPDAVPIGDGVRSKHVHTWPALVTLKAVAADLCAAATLSRLEPQPADELDAA